MTTKEKDKWPAPPAGQGRFPRYRIMPRSEEWSSKKVYTSIHRYLKSQIHFTENWQSVVISLWAMGTYLHKQFPCYGHLWLNSPTTHSGKSKLLYVLSALCYKSSDPQIEPTAAVIFRFPSSIGGTLLLDEVDNLDPQKRSDVIGVLNHYHKSGSVMRAAPGKNRKFELEKYPLYCPKVIAGIESLPVTLQDRCIRIILHRKDKSEEVQRFLPGDVARLAPLRNQIDAWSVRKFFPVIAAYQDRQGLGIPASVEDDRLRDILEPLFAIASVLPSYVKDELKEGASTIAKSRKSDEEDSNPVVAAVGLLKKHFPEGKDVWTLRTGEAVEILGEIPGCEDTARVQNTLRKLGFRSQSCRFEKRVLRAYRISLVAIEKLARRYR